MRTRLLLLVLVACLAACGDVLCAQSATPQEAAPAAYFGMHIHKAATTTAWPDVAFKTWRLWDAGVAWSQLEPARGQWQFNLLDQYVDLAQQHHVDILLTLGLTPHWASSRPEEKSDYGPGNASEPKDMAEWRTYVWTVATRYKGRIHEYEIWNEPNRRTAFSGDAALLAEMTREAYAILKKVDSTNIVVSPSATAGPGLAWLDQFLAHGGGKYVDIIAYHFYVFPAPPENMLPLIMSVKQTMAAHGVGKKPLWNTESGWAKPKVFSSAAEAAAYVSRAYLVEWAGGVSRFYWYAWDNHGWVTLEMTDAKTQKSTPAAAAYATTESWLLESVMKNYEQTADGTWTCELDRGKTRSWVVWNTAGNKVFQAPDDWAIRSTVDLSQAKSNVPGNDIMIGPSPLLLQH